MPCYTVTLADINQIVCTGWLPPLPDMRDLSASHDVIAPMAKLLKTDATQSAKRSRFARWMFASRQSWRKIIEKKEHK